MDGALFFLGTCVSIIAVAFGYMIGAASKGEPVKPTKPADPYQDDVTRGESWRDPDKFKEEYGEPQ